jgi:hypothetical protein
MDPAARLAHPLIKPQESVGDPEPQTSERLPQNADGPLFAARSDGPLVLTSTPLVRG